MRDRGLFFCIGEYCKLNVDHCGVGRGSGELYGWRCCWIPLRVKV